jgi:hypothetical protein
LKINNIKSRNVIIGINIIDLINLFWNVKLSSSIEEEDLNLTYFFNPYENKSFRKRRKYLSDQLLPESSESIPSDI